MLYGCIYRNCSYWFSIKAALWADAKADFKKVIKGWNHVRHVRSVCVCAHDSYSSQIKATCFIRRSRLLSWLSCSSCYRVSQVTGPCSRLASQNPTARWSLLLVHGGSLWRDKDSSVRGCSTIGVHQVNVNMTRPHFFIIHPCVSSWNYKTLAFPQIYSPSEE